MQRISATSFNILFKLNKNLLLPQYINLYIFKCFLNVYLIYLFLMYTKSRKAFLARYGIGSGIKTFRALLDNKF